MQLPTTVILAAKVRSTKRLRDRSGPIPVHFAASGCGHADCAEHYDLSMACLRARIAESSRVTFGVPPAPLYVDTLCGHTRLWLMPERYAEQWATAYPRSSMLTMRQLCWHCERIWWRLSGP